MKKMLEDCIRIAQEAGKAIMEVYNSDDFAVEQKKEDGYSSPLTKADKAANKIIEQGLKNISNLPILSEEGDHNQDFGDEFWLVDPLDGTKEFIKKNGEFTVNIALIRDNKPVLGVVYAPAHDVTYATDGSQVFKIKDGQRKTIQALFEGEKPVIVTSRSHLDERTEALLKDIGPHQQISSGSSIKLCLVAEGTAAMYPRFTPTMIWDTAAADAIVRAAGGNVIDADTNKPLVYKPSVNLKNPYFIVTAKNYNLAKDK